MSFIPSEKEALLKKTGMHEDDDEDQKKNSKKNFLRLDGTNCPTAHMDWCNKKLQNLAPGTAATDAVNKSQLDAAVIEADPLAIRKDGSSLVSSDIPFASHKLTQVAAGSASDDAVNKGQLDSGLALKASVSYVDAADAVQDAAIAAKASVSYVDGQNASQDTAIALKASQSYVDSQNATQDSAIALKASTSYVDSQDALKVSKSGDSMSGNLDMSNNMVQGLSNVRFQTDGVGGIGNGESNRPSTAAIKDLLLVGQSTSSRSCGLGYADYGGGVVVTNLLYTNKERGDTVFGLGNAVNAGEPSDITHLIYETSPFQYSEHFRFGRTGTFTMGGLNIGSVPATPDIVWNVDGGGNIGAPGKRVNNILVKLSVFAGDKVRCDNLGVGNTSSASTPGSIVKRMPIFDLNNNLLGYIPIYNSIS